MNHMQLKQMTVLVVDGNPSDSQQLQLYLGRKVRFTSVRNGKDALGFLAQSPINLLLIADSLPDMTGFDLLRAIHQQEQYKNLPILMTTADHSQKKEAACAMAGAFDIIRKPFIPILVVKKVEQVLALEYLNKNLETEVSRQTQLAEDRLASSRRLYEETIMALAKTVDAKDRYTRGHSQRVATYARFLAYRLGWNKEEQQRIYYMGLLHDIGKIGIPEAILRKTSRLTDEEYDIIKQHTIIGYNILNYVAEFPELKIGARWHHERYDGTGYPDGLKSDTIPVYARIIAVADTYDAMTSKRSYRDILPQDVVRKEIEKASGKQLDPKYADIMILIIDSDKDYRLHEQ